LNGLSNAHIFARQAMWELQRTSPVAEKSICLAGKVGIGTDQSQEALTVHGNIQMTGQLLHPSDRNVNG
jgi:hypothetical protein